MDGTGFAGVRGHARSHWFCAGFSYSAILERPCGNAARRAQGCWRIRPMAACMQVSGERGSWEISYGPGTCSTRPRSAAWAATTRADHGYGSANWPALGKPLQCAPLSEICFPHEITALRCNLTVFLHPPRPGEPAGDLHRGQGGGQAEGVHGPGQQCHGRPVLRLQMDLGGQVRRARRCRLVRLPDPQAAEPRRAYRVGTHRARLHLRQPAPVLEERRPRALRGQRPGVPRHGSRPVQPLPGCGRGQR
ncbi:hypothetical protein D3C81_1254240 [compost metagenome]